MPWNQTKVAQSNTSKKRKRKKLPKLRKEVWFVFAGIVAILCLIFIPQAIQKNKLKKLGYDKNAITAIRSQKMAKTVIDNEYYSQYLNDCFIEGSVNTDYLSLYTVIDGDKYLDNTDFLIVARLKEKGYEEDQILNLYKNLHVYEITPLLVFDYQPLEQNYIDDCLSHSENSATSFTLTGDYYTWYENTIATDSSQVTMLVNKTYYLDENYIPKGMVELSNQAGASGTEMLAEAASAMEEWAAGAANVGTPFYATNSYRSYDSQATLYENYVINHGQEQADRESARAGFSEHQTGLTCDVTATGQEDLDFSETTAYLWVSTNCMDYGWILRYPEGKETITGYEYESWHYRYVGKEVAQALYKTNFTYDEFWCLYLKPWDNEENKPSEEILTSTDWHNLLEENTNETDTQESE